MDISEEDIIMTTQVSNLSEHDHNDQQKCHVYNGWLVVCVSMNTMVTHCCVIVNIQHTLCKPSIPLRVSHSHLYLLHIEMICSPVVHLGVGGGWDARPPLEIASLQFGVSLSEHH